MSYIKIIRTQDKKIYGYIERKKNNLYINLTNEV